MKLFSLILLSLSASSVCAATTDGSLRRRTENIDEEAVAVERVEDHDDITMDQQNKVKISVTNIAYQQPFGAFFVMTHTSDATPIFKLGGNATEALAILAEDGNPAPLVEAYGGSSSVGYVAAVNEDAPYFGGETLEFLVPYDCDYPYLTIASMAINTNDCFVALNGVKLEPKAVLNAPGYDAGSEENNELCNSIPGPACADTSSDNVRSGNGEGFVHVHRGFFGVGDLSQPGYDWRNPMMRVEMSM